MKITVQLFAGIAQAINKRTWQGELPEGSRVADLLAVLAEEYPAASSLLQSSFASVNQAYADPDTVLQPEDEVAILPPVSGGQEALEEERFTVQETPLSVADVFAKVLSPQYGAVNLFVGTVREMTHGKRTVYLEYEAYQPMAVKMMKQIGEEIEEKWPGTAVAMAHRIGRLELTDLAVVIAVATPHRAASFEASRYAIERLKEIVPIWKKENWSDGTAWVGHQQGPWDPLKPGQEE